MSLFMGKFVEEVNNFGHLVWRTASSAIKSTVHAICCCVDAPARAAVMNMVQFNGMFGCPWCYACGEHHEGGQRYMNVTAEELRTAKGMLRDMKFAIDVGEPVNGLKGPSPLSCLKGFDLVLGQTVEYMHCVLLGVTRCFTDTWCDSSNNQEPYYIGRPITVAQVDKKLLSIRPPQCFTRLPRSIKERCHWKASEWRHWLLFYAVPTCTGILPQRYLNHFVLLVEAVHILLSEELTAPQLQRVGRLLQEFVSRAKNLYSPRLMTFNLHQLLHLASAAESFGPLWAHSAFVFESGNGRLLKTITGAKGVPNQVVERLVMLQQLHLVLTLTSFETKVKDFTSSLLGYPKTSAVTCVDAVSLFGNADPVPKLTAEEIASLRSVYMPWYLQ
ncbi:uncharacterized protein LOC142775449 [Rhipicephalus microplus]|uniref:uncharacterized protein LOC142775449 n=1 Tax=Rhipicephalus microplus TaxID=6941 RepID=UPI003F6C3628